MKKILVNCVEYGQYEFYGDRDHTVTHGDYEIRFLTHTDRTSPVSKSTMHPRMYGKIDKMMAWNLFPDYDYYVWIDSRISFHSPEHVIDFVESTDGDIGLFQHRFNKSISQEYLHVKVEHDKGNSYITSRYDPNLMEKQCNKYVEEMSDHAQKNHFELGLFCYSKDLVKNKTSNVMLSWFAETMMWSCNDQISMPYCLWQHNIKPHIHEGTQFNNKWTSNDYSNYA